MYGVHVCRKDGRKMKPLMMFQTIALVELNPFSVPLITLPLQVQVVLLIILLIAITDFFIGSFISRSADSETHLRGFTGYLGMVGLLWYGRGVTGYCGTVGLFKYGGGGGEDRPRTETRASLGCWEMVGAILGFGSFTRPTVCL